MADNFDQDYAATLITTIKPQALIALLFCNNLSQRQIDSVVAALSALL